MNLNLDLTPTEEALKEYSGNGLFISNGMVDVVIDTVYVRQSKTKDSKSLSLCLILKKAEDEENPKAQTQTIYDAMILRKTDGSVNVSGKDLLIKLAVVTGVNPQSINETESKIIIAGKDKKEITVDCIPELSGRKFTGKFQQEFSEYNDKIYEKVQLLTVFRLSDKATAQEIDQKDKGVEVELGKQFKLESEVEIKPKYSGTLTEEKVKASRNKTKSEETANTKPKMSSLLDDE